MVSLNKIILIGRLTADPEVRVTTEDVSLAKFSIAVDRPFTNGDKTDFMNIICWRKLADQAAKEMKKGMLVLVEGRIQIRTYDDKEGEKNWATEVVANQLQLLDKKAGASKEDSSVDKEIKESQEFTEDDIPF
ncbi:MAG: hypothetical protein A2Y40_03870 [Candidatus Margulisbacteria bacterium GWF2_35_9]|nr:MAG: hypothetical protein A2Y40_03870 [Candidatus Margulisbacteria bacterium GWF2_35_9]